MASEARVRSRTVRSALAKVDSIEEPPVETSTAVAGRDPDPSSTRSRPEARRFINCVALSAEMLMSLVPDEFISTSRAT